MHLAPVFLLALLSAANGLRLTLDPHGAATATFVEEAANAKTPIATSLSVAPTPASTLAASSTCLFALKTPKPSQLRCGFEGRLKTPQPYRVYRVAQSPSSDIAFTKCRNSCLTSSGCVSFGFDASVNNRCELFARTIDSQGPQRQTGPLFYNRHCFLSNCNPSELADGGFEHEPSGNFWGAAGYVASSRRDNSSKLLTVSAGYATPGEHSSVDFEMLIELDFTHGDAGVFVTQPQIPLYAGTTYDFAMSFKTTQAQYAVPGVGPILEVRLAAATGGVAEVIGTVDATTVANSLDYWSLVQFIYTAPTSDYYSLRIGPLFGQYRQMFPRAHSFNATLYVDNIWLQPRS